MMRWIVGWSLQARFLVVAIAAGLMFSGIWQLRDMPVDTLPEFQPTTVHVQAEALGLSAAEVEQLVTVPLEQDLLSFVPWVDVIRSESIPGLSSIELIFQPGTDLYRARQMVQERLSEAPVALPGASRVPQMLQPLSSTNRVMMIGLSSSELSLIDMSVLARWTIKPRLMGVPDVANVAIWGQREQQLQVQVDPERLRDQGVLLDEVIETTGNALWWSPLGFVEASTPGTGGFIDTPNQRLTVQHILPISSPEDLAQVPIQDKPDVQLGDVAEVVQGHQLLIGDAITNNGPSLLLVIEKFPGANTLEVTRAVEEELEALSPGLSGIEIDPTIYRPATAIDRGIDDLTLAVLISLVLVVLLLSVFFFDWRATLISAVVIPLSLAAAAAVLNVSGASFNVIVLAGLVLAVAIVVDDVLIDVDNIRRRLRERRAEGSGQSAASTIIDASLEMRGSVVFAALIILLSVLPVFFLYGQSGEFFPPLALAYALAALAAMLVSLTVTPALAMFILANAPLSQNEPPLVRRLKSGYGRAFSRFIRIPGAPYAAIAVIALVGLAALTQLSQPSLLPEFKQRDLLINWDGAPGTSQPEMSRIVSAAAGELESIPGVRNVGAHVGRAIMSDQIVGINSGEIWVSIDSAADYDATVAAIREVVDGYPGLARDVVTYPEERVREVLAGADKDVTVRLYGENLDVLRTEAEELRQVLSGIDGVVDPQVELPVVEPTIEIEVDLAAAQRHGLNPGAVRRTASTLVSSLIVGALFEDQKVFEVVVWSTPETRADLISVRDLPIDKPDGSQVRLQDVADIRIEPNPNVIEREAISRFIDITTNVSGRDLEAVVGDIERRLQEAELPLEYHAEVLEGFADRQSARDRVLPFAVAAAIGIFLLLQAAFGSWRLAFLAFFTLPIALVGGVLAAFADGGAISIGSYAGFFVLLGLAARNGIVLINHYQHLEQHEGEAFGPGLVLRGAQERIAPILMTALATGLALVPLMLLGDIFGHEIVYPMAIVILGGLVTSTLLNLFIVPALYLRFAPGPETDTSLSPTTGGGS
jgi:CzcA family heavy metal efflux pump